MIYLQNAYVSVINCYQFKSATILKEMLNQQVLIIILKYIYFSATFIASFLCVLS